jgi:hypothetical protein
MPETFSTGYVGNPVQPCPGSAPKQSTHWIEIELIGEDDKPIPWTKYRAALPDGSTVEGFLDDHGFARIDGQIAGGTCQVTFQDLDQDAVAFLRTSPAR